MLQVPAQPHLPEPPLPAPSVAQAAAAGAEGLEAPLVLADPGALAAKAPLDRALRVQRLLKMVPARGGRRKQGGCRGGRTRHVSLASFSLLCPALPCWQSIKLLPLIDRPRCSRSPMPPLSSRRGWMPSSHSASWVMRGPGRACAAGSSGERAAGWRKQVSAAASSLNRLVLMRPDERPSLVYSNPCSATPTGACDLSTWPPIVCLHPTSCQASARSSCPCAPSSESRCCCRYVVGGMAGGP